MLVAKVKILAKNKSYRVHNLAIEACKMCANSIFLLMQLRMKNNIDHGMACEGITTRVEMPNRGDKEAF